MKGNNFFNLGINWSTYWKNRNITKGNMLLKKERREISFMLCF